jgi:glycogen synthase
MRIWLAPSAYAPHRGGVEEVADKLAHHLVARGHEVMVVTNRHPHDLPQSEVIDGIDVRRIGFTAPGRHPVRATRHLLGRAEIQRTLGEIGAPPDVLNVHCASVQLPALAAFARRSGVPLVVSTHGETEVDAAGLYQRSGWMRRHLRRASAQAAALTACSAWTAVAAAAYAPAFADADIVHNGVDAADWELPPPSAAPVVAAWGRHVDQKGFDLLLSAFELLRTRRPDVRLRLGGDGPLRRDLQRIAGPGVEFTGSLTRAGVRELLRESRVVAVPSRVEPFGIVALEALAAGRGLVYSSHGGLAEAAGDCGRAADPYDADTFAAALLDELGNPTPYAVGRARAGQMSWQAAVARYEAILSRAVSA